MKRFLATFVAFAALTLPIAAPAQAAPATMATMPTCAAGDPVVWVNISSKVFHMSGDSYYGKTKKGKYACKSAAVAMGAHLSASKMKGGASAMNASDGMSPDAMSSAMPMQKKKHHRMMATSVAPPTP